MRYLELRRHSVRTGGEDRLTPRGIELARRVGVAMERPALVLSSRARRTIETAEAMGFGRPELADELTDGAPGMEVEVDLPCHFADYARAVRCGGIAAAHAVEQARYMRRVAARLRDGERALLVSHSGIVETTAVGCLPEADHASWGRPCGHCEGVELAYDGGEFREARVLRVDAGGPTG